MALAHYLYIWWLHGMAFHLVDAVLFLNIRASSLVTPFMLLKCIYDVVVIFVLVGLVSLYWFCTYFEYWSFFTGPSKCYCEACQRIHQTAYGFGNPSWGTSWCHIWRAQSIWWWVRNLQGNVHLYLLPVSFNSFSVWNCECSNNYRNQWQKLRGCHVIIYSILHVWDLGMSDRLICILSKYLLTITCSCEK